MHLSCFLGIKIPVGSPAIHPELLCGDTESNQIEQGSNPAVEGVLIVAILDIFPQCLKVGVGFFLQTDVLDESHTKGENVVVCSSPDRTYLLM